MKRKMIIAVALVTVALMASAGFAFGRGHGQGRQRGHFYGMRARGFSPLLLKQVGIDAKRLEAIEKILFEARIETQKVKLEIMTKKFSLKGAYLAADEAQIRKEEKEIFKLKEKNFNTKLDAKIKILKMLTPEERAKIAETRRAGMGERMMRGERGNPGKKPIRKGRAN